MKTNVMKRKLVFLLSGLVLLFCLAACSQEDNTEALTKWYNSKDRTQIERQINTLYQAQGLRFSLTVEEPDTIVYNYQYTDANSLDATTQESISSMLKVFMDSAAPAVKSDIEQYQKTYHLPVKNIRMVYLDSNGNELFSMDIDENYEPSDTALAKQYKDLQEWLNSDGKDSFVSAINPSLEPSGITMDFDADGDTLILIYRFVEQQDLSDYTQEDLDALSDNFAKSIGSDAASMMQGLEAMLGFKIKDMRIQIRNADNTLICDVSTE